MKRIIIIEDDLEFASGLAGFFNAADDFDVVGVFHDAESFLEQAEKAGELLLVDLGLPGMCGAELIASVKEKDPSIICVAHTVLTDRKNVLEALRAGADGYLVKGLQGEELLRSLRTLEEGGAPLTSQVARLLLSTFRAEQLPEEALSPREGEVLKLLSEGYSYQQAADDLILSVHTIHDHVKSIYHKLNVSSRGQAVAKARQFGWLG